MVRRLVSAGADFIKVAGSGGGTPGSLSDYPSFSVDELRAIVEAAHDLGRRVTIHCTATAAIDRAVAAVRRKDQQRIVVKMLVSHSVPREAPPAPRKLAYPSARRETRQASCRREPRHHRCAFRGSNFRDCRCVS